jgi:hypothetical protein
MSSVWVTIPSARPPEVVAEWAKEWKERGYRVALYRDDSALACADWIMLSTTQYPGYANAVNALVAYVMAAHNDAEWFVIGGDDVFPDPNHSAEEIARECELYFGAAAFGQQTRVGGTYGVMQCTGDRWGVNPDHLNPAMRSAYIDRVCGSAWIGREFAKRVNQGKGPLWPEYQHMFVDEELQAVATKLGVLWQRPDLTQMHQHEARKHRSYTSADIPPHLKKWAGPEHWKEAEAIFKGRRAAGFPGSEPL